LDKDVNHELRAAKAWPVLTSAAAARRTITYGELAKAIGIHHRPLRHVLGLVQGHCLDEGLPPLTILVVRRSGNGEPGDGFIAWDAALEDGRESVYLRDWEAVLNPFVYALEGVTQRDLAQRLVADAGQAGEIHRLVKVRGVRQAIFREALLNSYAGACAFCGLSFREALEAAHIHGWAECDAQDQVNPRNGILLCSSHHRMFDWGNLDITPELTIEYSDPEKNDGPYSHMDDLMSVALHGEKMRLPLRPELRPDPLFIAARRALDQ
jgi:putative restriction endonuclease